MKKINKELHNQLLAQYVDNKLLHEDSIMEGVTSTSLEANTSGDFKTQNKQTQQCVTSPAQ